jgi:hypothetical protein
VCLIRVAVMVEVYFILRQENHNAYDAFFLFVIN